MTPEEISANIGTPTGTVRAQLTRIQRKVRSGDFSPPPLPIEQIASRKRIYLAGFDVFRTDAMERGHYLRELCASFGFEATYPLDANVRDGLSPTERATWIYRSNIEAIRACDIVMANVDDFRGPGEADSGTAFEIGFSAALNKDVWAYTTNEGTVLDRVSSQLTSMGAFCERGFLVEDFGLSKNLMIACAARIVSGDAATCLAEMATKYGMEGTPSLYRPAGESEIRSTG
ncbi:nucleoside 2-deoxyribosyltransferase [Paraburkholderia sp. GAS334]|uniref:nucleoside 2-deoxyribosyltransferase n=1 Tax=Paraburkholderia sp. GAS334 TaxID=3035131 RepID=UPI003D247BD1